MTRVTLKDVAEAAGVSISTASLAIRGKGHLKEATIRKIEATAQELGYTPDPILSSLGSSRFRNRVNPHGTPVAIFRFPISHSVTTPPNRQYVSGLIEHSKHLGYHPAVYDSSKIGSITAFLNTLYHQGFAGIIIVGQPPEAFFDKVSLWTAFSILQCGRYERTLPIHTVRSDVYRSIKLIWSKMTEAGCRRIGLAIGRHPDLIEDDEARLGAAWAMEQFYATSRQRVPLFLDRLTDTDAMVAWYFEHRPDGIIGFHPGQYQELVRHGVKIPGEACMALLHAPSKPSNESPTIAGLHQCPDEIARQSILLLDALVRHNERGIPEHPRHVLIPSQWIDGESLPLRPAPPGRPGGK